MVTPLPPFSEYPPVSEETGGTTTIEAMLLLSGDA